MLYERKVLVRLDADELQRIGELADKRAGIGQALELLAESLSRLAREWDTLYRRLQEHHPELPEPSRRIRVDLLTGEVFQEIWVQKSGEEG